MRHYKYLVREAGLGKAMEFSRAVDHQLAQLLEFPHLGAPRPLDREQLPNARMWEALPFKNYLIFYEPVPQGIRVLALVHAKEDYRRLLD